MTEKKDSERILLKFPIRVSAFGEANESFTEETHTVEVNRLGARIALQHSIHANDTIRIVNLENLREADFRVVAPIHLEGEGAVEWSVECLEPDRNLWDIHFAPPVDTPESSAGALLECRECSAQSFCNLQEWEYHVLKSGPLQRFCSKCGEPTKWQYADVSRRVEEADHHEAPATPPPASPNRPVELPPEKWIGRREHKRLALKLPTLIRDANGREEASKSENISKGGIAIGLGMILEVGDIVSVFCPYSEGGQNLEQKAEVRNRRTFFAGERWICGLRYIS